LNFLLQVGLWAASMLLEYLLMEEPPTPDKTTFEELDVPKIKQGTKIPVVLGTVRIKSPTVFWYGDFKCKQHSDGSNYNHLGWGYIWCLNPIDSMNRIFIDDSPVYFSDARTAVKCFDARSYQVQIPKDQRIAKISSNSKIGFINADPKFKALNIAFRMGDMAQEKNEYLMSAKALNKTNISADRGIVTTVFENSNSVIEYQYQAIVYNQYFNKTQSDMYFAPRGSLGAEIYQGTPENKTAIGIAFNWFEQITETILIPEDPQGTTWVSRWTSYELMVISGVFNESTIFMSIDDSAWLFNHPIITGVTVSDKTLVVEDVDLATMFGVGRNTIPNISMVFERTQKDWNGDLIWHPELATIVQPYKVGDETRSINQMNGVHLIRDMLLSKTYGLGGDYEDANINDEAFLIAARTCFSEGMGFGVLLSSSDTTVNEVVKDIILSRINGKLYKDNNGQWVIKLLRDDYDVDTLPVYNESNIISITDWKKGSPSDAINSVTVNYTNPANFVQKGITARSTVDIQIGGIEKERVIDAPEITSSDLAALVASRDLESSLSNPSAFTITGNRTMYNLNLGDVFKVNYREFTGLVVRALEIDKGDFTGKMVFSCIEDIFNSGNTIISTGGGGGTGVVNQPQPVIDRKLIATPYIEYLITDYTPPANPEQDDLIFYGKYATGDTQYINPNINGVTIDSRGYLDTVYSLVNEIDIFDTEITLDYNISGIETSDFEQFPTFLLIDDELVAITSMNISTRTITVLRGQADTIPSSHIAESLVYIGASYSDIIKSGTFKVLENTQFTNGNTVDVRMLTRTSLGLLDVSSAPVDQVVFNARQIRPYRPDNIKVNNSRYTKEYTCYILEDDDTNLTWVERNRLTQISYLASNSPTVEPEEYQEYKLVLREADGTFVKNITGITGTEYDYTTTNEINDFGSKTDKIIDIYANRVNPLLDTWDSFTHWSIAIKRFKALIITVNEATNKFEITNENIGCPVHYTITNDGSEPNTPTENDIEYIEPIDFQNDFWIKAKAFCGEEFESPVYQKKWIILDSKFDTTDAIFTSLNSFNTNN